MQCLKHGDCKTGFCPNGTCREPQADDPCVPYGGFGNQGSCLSDYYCDLGILRCKLKGYMPLPQGTCQFDSDCHRSEFCDRGVCVNKGTGRRECIKGNCQDGFECSENICIPRCRDDYGCKSSNICVQSPSSGFKICVPGERQRDPAKAPTIPEVPQHGNERIHPDHQWGGVFAGLFGGFLLIGMVVIVVVSTIQKKRRENAANAPILLSAPSMPQYSPTSNQQPMTQYSDLPPAYPFTENGQ